MSARPVAVVAVCGPLLLAAATLLWLRRRYVVITVNGLSMHPTYGDGERVLIRRVPVPAVRPGQVVVFAALPDRARQELEAEAGGRGSPEDPVRVDVPRWMIKRAIAVPGDLVPRRECPALRSVPEPTVPAGHLVVLGDNPKWSYDSRQSGYVAPGRLMGVVVRRLSLPPGSAQRVDQGRGHRPADVPPPPLDLEARAVGQRDPHAVEPPRAASCPK
ncbi:S26 family signal peptidase [Streptosporangium sp. NPDC049644]|uniref:S26 family signal peptidase n=1 Tax=Streptosporangium sp. NPDC049644 TaxID=3155507 RepID=UPI00341A41EF